MITIGCVPTTTVAATRCQNPGGLPLEEGLPLVAGVYPHDRRFWKHYLLLLSVKIAAREFITCKTAKDLVRSTLTDPSSVLVKKTMIKHAEASA